MSKKSPLETIAEYRVSVKFTMWDVLLHLLKWTIITILTLGFGIFFWPYSSAKFIIESTVIHHSRHSLKFICHLSLWNQLGHILIWMLLSIITCGIALPFYLYSVVRTSLHSTRAVAVEEYI